MGFHRRMCVWCVNRNTCQRNGSMHLVRVCTPLVPDHNGLLINLARGMEGLWPTVGLFSRTVRSLPVFSLSMHRGASILSTLFSLSLFLSRREFVGTCEPWLNWNRCNAIESLIWFFLFFPFSFFFSSPLWNRWFPSIDYVLGFSSRSNGICLIFADRDFEGSFG